jgi:rhodanese-related sulfurtransferase
LTATPEHKEFDMTKNVTAAQLKEWLDSGQAVLIDVREPAEYESEHIPGAILIPLATLTQDKMPAHAGKKLVFQCRSGNRGGKACEKMASLGTNDEIYNLEGGITAWTQAGYHVETSGKSCLPLDQQVRLTVGLCILISSILVYSGHPVFLLVIAAFGVGLTLSGLTGCCGLAVLLAKMPWNQGGSCKSGGSCAMK